MLLCVLVHGVAGKTLTATTSCARVGLEPKPIWAISASWDHQEEGLLVVDISRGSILVFSDVGAYRESIARPGLGDLEFNRPLFLARTEEGLLLNDGGTRLLKLSRTRMPATSLPLNRPGEIGIQLFSLTDTVLSTTGVFGYADVAIGGDRYTSGFVHLRSEADEGAELVEEVQSTSEARRMYLLVGPSVATVHGTPYYLRYGHRSFIGRGVGAPKTLEAFPESFRQVPSLPAGRGMSTMVMEYKALEQSTTAAGLYAQGDFLYLLARQPASRGATLWSLTQIDPIADIIVRTYYLPTSTSFLVLAPGAKQWAVLEKGPVTAPGKQDIPTLLLIPGPWLSSAESPLVAKERARLDLCAAAGE